MGQRRRGPNPLLLPTWLSALLSTEGADDRRRQGIASRLGVAGVSALDHEGPESQPSAVTFKGPRIQGRVAVNTLGLAPVTAAIDRLIAEVETCDQFIRLRLAAKDMEGVAVCARELAAYRHAPGAAEAVHSPYAAVEDVLEAGLVTVYARSYTGVAELPGRYHPKADEKELHDALMSARSAIHAHADQTPHRSLIDAETLLGMDGPPSFSIAETRMSADVLLRIA